MDFPVLEKNPLFRGLDAAARDEALACLEAKTKNFHKNEWIFAEGDPVRYTGVVLTGSVMILKEDYCGNRYIQTVLQPPELFGEVFSCADLPFFPVSALAAEPTAVLLLNCKKLFCDCGAPSTVQGRLVNNMVRLIAAKNLALNTKTDILLKRTTADKLMTYLSAVAKQQGTRDFRIPYDRQQLADFLGVERSALSAEISKLRKAGRLISEKNHFILTENPAE